MSPFARPVVVLALMVAVLATGCASAATTFSPTGPCVADGRAPGAYPALEALVPRNILDTDPKTVDSGRSCTAAALGTLVTHDVHDLRFAGATWDRGGGAGDSVAVFALPDRALPVAWMEEFYEAGARAARNTDQITTDRPTIGGRSVFRLRTLNELSYQTVVVWQDGATVRAVLAAIQLGSAVTKAQQDAVVAHEVEAAMAQGSAPASAPPS